MPLTLLKYVPAPEARALDADLLVRFADHRDEAAFAELVRRHGPLVLRVCRALAPGAADDAFQAAFLVLARRAAAIRAPGALGGWLVGVAGRVARRMRAADRARAAREQAAARERPAAADAPDGTDHAAVVADELAKLPDELREPLVLCLMLGRTHEQAAAELGRSARTVRRRLDRAKVVLRARFESRGIVPAVAAALLVGLAEPGAAVPPALTRETGAVAFRYLAGEPLAPGLAVAGELASSSVRVKASALVGACAAVLVGFGVVWSDERPTSAPYDPPVVSPRPRIDGGSPPPFDPQVVLPRPRIDSAAAKPPAPKPPAIDPPAKGGEAFFKGTNFVAFAPTPAMARALVAEAEYQRKQQALKWFGEELPPWPQPCPIRFTAELGKGSGFSTFTFGKGADGKPAVIDAEMTLRGDFVTVLSAHLPHEVTHAVVASYFGRPVPRWADEGIAILSEPDDEQLAHNVRIRELLNAGRGIRVRVLVRMNEYPKDLLVLYAQGHSLARFLSTRPVDGLPDLKAAPDVGALFRRPGWEGQRRLLAFVRLGSDGNTAESWQKAAESVYGFNSLDELEEAWLAWLREPDSAPKAAPKPRPERPADLIPPPKLPERP